MRQRSLEAVQEEEAQVLGKRGITNRIEELRSTKGQTFLRTSQVCVKKLPYQLHGFSSHLIRKSFIFEYLNGGPALRVLK